MVTRIAELRIFQNQVLRVSAKNVRKQNLQTKATVVSILPNLKRR